MAVINVANSLGYQDVAIPSGFLHIYFQEMSPGSIPDIFQLSVCEQDRAKKYNDTDARNRYVQAHVFLRKALSVYLNILPADIAIEYTAYGQPVLAEHVHARHVFFSLSYSGAMVMIGLSGNPVGVDIEQIKPIDNINEVASNIFSAAEQEVLMRITPPVEKQQYFLKVWTLKEAFIKGTGLGVSYGMQRFSALPSVGNPILLCDEGNWILKQVNMPDGYIGAAAIQVAAIRLAEH
jgi:4'-phosphopantetheinyl transferase